MASFGKSGRWRLAPSHVGEFARVHVPQVVESSRRMTALTKPDGGIRGIVSGDVIRWLVARAMAQQLGPAVKSATTPHQYALSTRAGCECIAHALDSAQGHVDRAGTGVRRCFHTSICAHVPRFPISVWMMTTECRTQFHKARVGNKGMR